MTGEVTEWLKVHAWNACVRKYREFESHLLRHIEKPCNILYYRVFYFTGISDGVLHIEPDSGMYR